MSETTIRPLPLKPGDLIAITSPAGIVRKDLVEGACCRLQDAGYRVRVMPHALGIHGSYSGSLSQRLDDITEALLDPEVRAIICSRGGYGSAQLLPYLDTLPLRDDPKWLVGFSDVTALHALMAKHGIVSIHASMAKALANHPLDFPPTRRLLRLLSCEGDVPPLPTGIELCLDTPARIIGGNFATLQALIGTPYDNLRPGIVLFIEDIAEPIYKIQRFLLQLRMMGVLDNLAALIVGEFTRYEADRNHATMEEMIAKTLGDVPFPVIYHAPIGHIDTNQPILYGERLRGCGGATFLSPGTIDLHHAMLGHGDRNVSAP